MLAVIDQLSVNCSLLGMGLHSHREPILTPAHCRKHQHWYAAVGQSCFCSKKLTYTIFARLIDVFADQCILLCPISHMYNLLFLCLVTKDKYFRLENINTPKLIVKSILDYDVIQKIPLVLHVQVQ